MTKKPLLFLLGAGFSLGANIPRKGIDINDICFQGYFIFPENGEKHYLNLGPDMMCYPITTDFNYLAKEDREHLDFSKNYGPLNMHSDATKRILKIIKHFLKEAEKAGIEKPNYEDVADFIFRIYEQQQKFPADKDPFIKHYIGTTAANYLEDVAEGSGDILGASALLQTSRNYISSVLKTFLGFPGECEKVKWLTDICRSSVTRVYTLNHDLLLEDMFKKHKVPHDNGFEEGEYWYYFHPRNYRDDSFCHIVKLHGSINWRPTKAPEKYGDSKSGILGIPKEDSYSNPEPEILVGRKIKIETQHSGPQLFLFTKFTSDLYQSNKIIVCGYSFNDEDINSRLIEWMCSSLENKMVVIHGEPDKLHEDMRIHAIRERFWKRWLDSSRIHFIKKWAQDVKVEDLETFII